ncbi:MAG: hypothetical protein NW224_08375 [Leptolyngbyaceae cyanobacterium bins.302]|nr:hypothetical protein [Leptolyngbyaceae cyanobacterium bins.302]
MSSHNRMVRIAAVALRMLEEIAMNTNSNSTRAEIIQLRAVLKAEQISSKQGAIDPKRLKQYEDKVKAILNDQIDVNKIDIDEWWDNL